MNVVDSINWVEFALFFDYNEAANFGAL